MIKTNRRGVTKSKCVNKLLVCFLKALLRFLSTFFEPLSRFGWLLLYYNLGFYNFFYDHFISSYGDMKTFRYVCFTKKNTTDFTSQVLR